MPPFVPTPFARSLTAHMCQWRARQDGSRHPLFAHWADGIHPRWRETARRVVVDDAVKLHGYAAAVTSSQAFALNLFLPWRDGPRAGLDALVATAIGEPIAVDRVQFEWVPPGALLGELVGDRPMEDEPATGVDVVLWARDRAGARVAMLVEVKLGEGGFTPCGGRESKANRRKDVCASAEAFLADPASCYLRRPWGKLRDRRYWQVFERANGSVRAAFPGADTSGACPFAADAQQPMRNLALAYALVQEGVVDRAWFVLCAHEGNPDVAERWAAWRALLPSPALAPSLRASDVLAAGRADGHGEWASWMAERYVLQP